MRFTFFDRTRSTYAAAIKLQIMFHLCMPAAIIIRPGRLRNGRSERRKSLSSLRCQRQNGLGLTLTAAEEIPKYHLALTMEPTTPRAEVLCHSMTHFWSKPVSDSPWEMQTTDLKGVIAFVGMDRFLLVWSVPEQSTVINSIIGPTNRRQSFQICYYPRRRRRGLSNSQISIHQIEDQHSSRRHASSSCITKQKSPSSNFPLSLAPSFFFLWIYAQSYIDK